MCCAAAFLNFNVNRTRWVFLMIFILHCNWKTSWHFARGKNMDLIYIHWLTSIEFHTSSVDCLEQHLRMVTRHVSICLHISVRVFLVIPSSACTYITKTVSKTHLFVTDKITGLINSNQSERNKYAYFSCSVARWSNAAYVARDNYRFYQLFYTFFE